jgi:DNA polymerase-3 subunit beta
MWINDSYLELKHAKGTMSIPTMSADEFPLPTLESDCTAVEFDSESLFRLLNRGKEFMSADELHPIMCGVYLYVNNSEYGVASTDTHKLYTESVSMASDKEVSAIVPAKAIPVLLDVINGTDKVSISFGSRSIVVKSELSMVSITLPTGRFPNVNSVIPKESIIECEINKDELLDAINRTMLFANATGLLKMTISGMLLAIDSEDFDTQKRSYEECVCSANVPDKFMIGVNGAKLRTVLSACDSDKVTLRMNAENKPILVKEDSKTLLLMPMMMN